MTVPRRIQPPAPLVLTVIGLGAFVTALDQTVVVTAIPSIMLDLKIPLSQMDRASWIVTAYLLGYTAIMPLVGRMGDVYGYSRVYRASLVLFCVGTVLVALAPNLEWMLGARAVQAVGGGATVPLGLAVASTALPDHQRGMAVGMVIAAAEAGSMLGPAYGGGIIAVLDWRWMFWLNVPQSAFLFALLFLLPSVPNPRDRVDFLGGLLLAAALVVLSVALSRQGVFTLSSATPFIIGAPGLMLVAVFVISQRRTVQPLVSAVLFRSGAFVAASLTQVLEGIALIIAMLTVPLMAETVMGKEPLTGALWLLRMTTAIPVGALLGGWLLSVFGVRPITALGLGLTALGLSLVSTWDLNIGEPWLTLHLLIAGLGFGLNNTPIMTRALSAAPPGYRGTAASLVVVARMMGMTLGLAALAAWGVEHFQAITLGLDLPLMEPGETFAQTEARVRDYYAQVNQAGLSVFHLFLRIAAGVALVAMLPALAMGPDRAQTAGHAAAR